MTFDLTDKFKEATLRHKEETAILAGQASGSITGLQERSAAASKSSVRKMEEQQIKDKKASELLKALQAIIDRLSRDIAQMEDAFRLRHGDAWREELALRILDEDNIPQRKDGESMEAYRARLEPLLIGELLNPDGSIKDEYKNDPELGDYAQWAQKKYHLNAAQGYARELENPDTAAARYDTILDKLRQNSDIEELLLTSHEATSKSNVQQDTKELSNSVTLEKHSEVSSSTDINNFLKPLS